MSGDAKGPLFEGLGPLVRVDRSDDPRLDLYRNLNDPSHRIRFEDDHSVFVVEGKLAVGRLLASGYSARSLLIDDHQLTSAEELVAATRAQGVTVFVASREVLATTVGFSLHRGIVAVAERPPPTDPHDLITLVVAPPRRAGTLVKVAVLEGLNDHENIGALFRNSAAFGVDAVFLDPTCADPLYRRSIRVSMGHALHVPYARFSDWPSGLQRLQAAGFSVAALAPRPPRSVEVPVLSLSDLATWTPPPGRRLGVAFLFGAEGTGLTQAAMALSDAVVAIPMAGNVDSLNVATAAAIAFHSFPA